MKYFSTRGGVKNVSFKDAVMMGLAEDGGLLLPDSFPQVDVAKLKGMAYTDVAFEIISRYTDDISDDTLKELINKSYKTFSRAEVVPVVKTGAGYLAELFHGPTYAFKDVALQLLGNLFEYILAERSEKLNIIGATSGDTGSAAIAGVRGKNNVNIAVLYPDGHVSAVQEKQMASVPDANVYTYAVDGTFDDCQNAVKALFADVAFKKKHKLGAVNSINWARILAQVVYYFYAYLQLNTNEKVNFVVPTGNFGNIFAGYCAKRMGLPVGRLIIATNENDILHRFISEGDYSLKEVRASYSPSMDIQISSNLERYLYYLYGSADRLAEVMNLLKTSCKIEFSGEDMRKVRLEFDSYGVNNSETVEAIKRVYGSDRYVLDPHTACGVQAAYKLNLKPENTVILATAHPAKFPDVVKSTLGFEPEQPEGIAKLDKLPLRRNKMANDINEFKRAIEKIDV